MNDSVPILLVIIIVLVILSGFFSATETAYTCSSKIKLKSMAHTKRIEKVLALTENFDSLLTAILIGNNIVNLTAASLSTIFFAKILINSKIDSTTISTIVLTLVVLIFGEILPKTISKAIPEKIAIFNYPFVQAFRVILFPLVFIFSNIQALFLKIFKIKNDDVITEEELLTMVEEAQEDGTLKISESEMIRSVIEFDDLEVHDIYVPRVDVIAVNIEDSLDHIKNVFYEQGFSRLPVYHDTIDTIVGIIHQSDFMQVYMEKGNIESILKPAYFITEHMKTSKLLKELQKRKIHMAIVIDEYGGTLGVVTMEDVLEELVGEIYDEHDEVISVIKKNQDNTYTTYGKTPLSEVLEYFKLDNADDSIEANTIGGFIAESIQDMPKVGTKCRYMSLEMEVTKATVKEVIEVKISVV